MTSASTRRAVAFIWHINNCVKAWQGKAQTRLLIVWGSEVFHERCFTKSAWDSQAESISIEQSLCHDPDSDAGDSRWKCGDLSATTIRPAAGALRFVAGTLCVARRTTR